MTRLTNKKTSDYIHNKLEKIRERMKDDTVSACFNSAYDDMYEIEKHNKDELRYEKLGQLEDIEEELGIDLLTLFKALKNGVYYFTRGMQLTKDYVGLIDDYISIGPRDKLSYSLMTGFEKQTLSVKDYGITWALTKEELL